MRITFLKKELSKLPKNSQNIFKKSNIDCYVKRPSGTIFIGKHSVSKDFYHTKSLKYYALENKSSKIFEYQPNELKDNSIENNYEECSHPERN